MKHLNPRQGITTPLRFIVPTAARLNCVKHLNPRQGITTLRHALRGSPVASLECETPKSPPGDYNSVAPTLRRRLFFVCETPKSPPGDYNSIPSVNAMASHFANVCETPKSPPGDYNAVAETLLEQVDVVQDSVKHLNPRQGITTLAFACIVPASMLAV